MLQVALCYSPFQGWVSPRTSCPRTALCHWTQQNKRSFRVPHGANGALWNFLVVCVAVVTSKALDWSNCRRFIAPVEPFKPRGKHQLLAKANRWICILCQNCQKSKGVCYVFCLHPILHYFSFLSSSWRGRAQGCPNERQAPSSSNKFQLVSLNHLNCSIYPCRHFISGEHDRIISVNGVFDPPTAVALQLTCLVRFRGSTWRESVPTCWTCIER